MGSGITSPVGDFNTLSWNRAPGGRRGLEDSLFGGGPNGGPGSPNMGGIVDENPLLGRVSEGTEMRNFNVGEEGGKS
jgi:hypothetical protein